MRGEGELTRARPLPAGLARLGVTLPGWWHPPPRQGCRRVRALPTRLGAALFINRRSRGFGGSCRALAGHPARRHAATEPGGRQRREGQGCPWGWQSHGAPRCHPGVPLDVAGGWCVPMSPTCLLPLQPALTTPACLWPPQPPPCRPSVTPLQTERGDGPEGCPRAGPGQPRGTRSAPAVPQLRARQQDVAPAFSPTMGSLGYGKQVFLKLCRIHPPPPPLRVPPPG